MVKRLVPGRECWLEKRLKDRYKGWAKFEVHGTPKDLDGARNLAERDKYQFQWWAVSLIEAQPSQRKKKGADTGIDGVKFFRDLDRKASAQDRGECEGRRDQAG